MPDRRFDLVLHGASGFVGRLVARHLRGGAGDARVALSGRSAERLRAVRDTLGVDWPVLATDAHDPGSMAELAASTRVVATTVGPYQKYGLPLVEACAAAGTSYCDLTGETLFVRDSAAAAHERARETGARIVHSAGFDSVPSDLGVLLLSQQAAADGAGTLGETALVVVSFKGGISGGTVDSLRTELATTEGDPSLRHVLADPYALSPDRAADPDGRDETDRLLPHHDPLLGRWVAPYPFGPHDSRIVRRSNALLGHPYGPGFRYREYLAVGGGPAAPVVAGMVTAGLGALVGGMRWAPTRALLDRALPSPGAGPSERTMSGGHFRIEVHTVTSSGARYVATIAAQGDPGYAATAVIFGEAALALARDELTSPGGVLTPAAALGEHLVHRLRAAGLTLTAARHP
ncbi:MAG TPA: saccharopine dehydrogenase NADP-binding domain-containing protein [Mycobacteriales bacterium]|nr:saccharopine dehydrogenase NADP-binding domain-containing protein [Mycobacteriales bacterium]